MGIIQKTSLTLITQARRSLFWKEYEQLLNIVKMDETYTKTKVPVIDMYKRNGQAIAIKINKTYSK